MLWSQEESNPVSSWHTRTLSRIPRTPWSFGAELEWSQLAFSRPLLWKTTLVLQREAFCGTNQRKNTSKSFIILRISFTCLTVVDLSHDKFYSWFLARARLVRLQRNFRFNSTPYPAVYFFFIIISLLTCGLQIVAVYCF